MFYLHKVKYMLIIQSSYYVHGPLGDENIVAVLYVSLCYKTVFLHLYLQFFYFTLHV